MEHLTEVSVPPPPFVHSRTKGVVLFRRLVPTYDAKTLSRFIRIK